MDAELETVRVIDFTSSLYLGIGHPHASLGEWTQLTTGAPAELGEPSVARRVATEIAELVGGERALVATSTLHVAWDLAELIVAMRAVVLVDHSAYPTLRVAAQLARARGAPVRTFTKADRATLRETVHRMGSRAAHRPVVLITDGFCPTCRHVAPIGEFAAFAGESGGFVAVDDTQALGVLGVRPTIGTPYGHGGGGSLPWSGSPRDHVMLVASLAKGFGSPMAVVASSSNLLERFTKTSMTRTHCSPPSLAALHAAARALSINRTSGDRLRARLAAVVRNFRERMAGAGVRLESGVFPIQSLHSPRGPSATVLHHELERRGIRTVLTGSQDAHGRKRARVTFVLTARHAADDIRRAAAAVESVLSSNANLPLLPAEVPCKLKNPAPFQTSAPSRSFGSAK